jgi:hypothetical protein
MGEAAEELWHVRLPHDEVKQLTLEQLDDLFRLDVISADTQVWQPGMDEWLPLSVVAGLGDDEPETMSIPVSQPPPTTVKRVASTTQNVWPPPAAPASSWPPPAVQASSFPPPPSRANAVTTRPPPPSARSNAPLTPAMSSWPPAAAWSDPPSPRVAVSGLAPTLAAGSTPFSAPLAPPLGVFEDTAPRASRGGSGGWVVVLSVLVGLGVTLYRNDVVHAAANSMGQTATFLKLETALGGPGFGTPRAVEKMMTRPKLEAEPVAATTPAATTTAAAAPTTPPAPAATAPSAPTSEAAKSLAEPAKAAPAPEAPKAAAPVARSAPASAPATRSGGSGAPDPDNVFKQPKKGKKGNEYDPLNPSL